MEAGSTKQLVRDGLFSLKTEVKMENRKMWFSVTLLCTLGMQQVLAAENVKGDRPNIVFILADDLGWTDLGVMGSDYYETPNIDRLAAEGLLFDNAYAAAANSAPSRACMMTGMYTPRHGVYTVSPPDRGDRRLRKLIPIANTDDVRADFVTMAERYGNRDTGVGISESGIWEMTQTEQALFLKDSLECRREPGARLILIFILIVILQKINVIWDWRKEYRVNT